MEFRDFLIQLQLEIMNKKQILDRLLDKKHITLAEYILLLSGDETAKVHTPINHEKLGFPPLPDYKKYK